MHDSSGRSTDDIVLVHSSDLHVDDDLGIGAYNGLIGLASVLATARSLAADIVLLAGDTFDNYRVSAPVLARATALLATAGVPVVLLPGNHDSIMPQCLLHRAGIIGLPDIHVLGVTNGHSVRAARTGNLGTRASRIRRHDAAAHATSENDAMADRHGAWPLCAARGMHREAHRAWKISDQDIAATEAHYVALGHWDRPVQAGDGRVPAYYSGSPDLARTVNAVRLSAATGLTVDRVPLIWV